MFERALERGEIDAPRAAVQTLIAEPWRRAGRFDDALEACEAAQGELADLESDDPDETVRVDGGRDRTSALCRSPETTPATAAPKHSPTTTETAIHGAQDRIPAEQRQRRRLFAALLDWRSPSF